MSRAVCFPSGPPTPLGVRFLPIENPLINFDPDAVPKLAKPLDGAATSALTGETPVVSGGANKPIPLSRLGLNRSSLAGERGFEDAFLRARLWRSGSFPSLDVVTAMAGAALLLDAGTGRPLGNDEADDATEAGRPEPKVGGEAVRRKERRWGLRIG